MSSFQAAFLTVSVATLFTMVFVFSTAVAYVAGRLDGTIRRNDDFARRLDGLNARVDNAISDATGCDHPHEEEGEEEDEDGRASY